MLVPDGFCFTNELSFCPSFFIALVLFQIQRSKLSPEKKKKEFLWQGTFFFFFYINQDITSRVEIEMSEEIIVEDPAPIIGSTCVSSAMVPKIVKKVIN